MCFKHGMFNVRWLLDCEEVYIAVDGGEDGGDCGVGSACSC